MSLTQELKIKDSAIRRIFDERLPAIKSLSLVVRPLLSAEDSVLPSTNFRPYDHRLVGTAFDYRARLFFEKFPLEQTIAFQGAQRSSDFGSGVMAKIFQNDMLPSHAKLMQRLGNAPPHYDRATECEICNHCLVLARFDELYRATGPALVSYDFGEIESFDDLISRNRVDHVDDLERLSKRFLEKFGRHFGQRARLNPTFSGSLDVRGADADLILEDLLIDFKCTVDFKLPLDKFRQSVYQLIGYAMLDYDDAHGIEKVGIYYARQGVLWSSDLESVLTVLSHGRISAISQLREHFVNTLSHRPAARHVTPPPQQSSSPRLRDRPPT